MKTPEQIHAEVGKEIFGSQTYRAFTVADIAKIIDEIQLDARISALDEAAETVASQYWKSDLDPKSPTFCNCLANKILSLATKLKEGAK